jgi:recombination protein RecT
MASAASSVPAVKDDRLGTVRDLLEKSKSNLSFALPAHIKSEYIIRVVLTSVQRTPELLDCDPFTLLGAVFQAAQLGLVPDGVLGQAYLVPFWNSKKRRKEVQFIPGYKGLIALARRSNEVSTVGAEVVHEKDLFVYELGIDPKLKHVPTDDASPGPIVKVYAFAKLKDGGFQTVVMNKRQVDAIRGRSQAAKSDYSPWSTDPEWMWKKTALKQLCKLLPASTELQRAISLEDRAEIGLAQDLVLELPKELARPDETPTPEDKAHEDQDRPALTAATAKLSDVMTVGGELGWNQVTITKFVKERFQKDLMALDAGDECFRVVVAMREHAENLALDKSLS